MVQDEAAPLLVRILVEVVDAVGVEQRGAAFDAMHFVAFAQQEFGEIGAVLAGDAGDESFFHRKKRRKRRCLLARHFTRPRRAPNNISAETFKRTPPLEGERKANCLTKNVTEGSSRTGTLTQIEGNRRNGGYRSWASTSDGPIWKRSGGVTARRSGPARRGYWMSSVPFAVTTASMRSGCWDARSSLVQ